MTSVSAHWWALTGKYMPYIRQPNPNRFSIYNMASARVHIPLFGILSSGCDEIAYTRYHYRQRGLLFLLWRSKRQRSLRYVYSLLSPSYALCVFSTMVTSKTTCLLCLLSKTISNRIVLFYLSQAVGESAFEENDLLQLILPRRMYRHC